MKTKSIESDFILVVYPWKSPYLTTVLEAAPPFVLDQGPHFVSFERSKNIGGSMTVDCFGAESTMEIGDWLVLRSKSSGRIDRSDYVNEGSVQFIGQVYNKNVSHFADADGNLRSTTQFTVREWSHVLHIQVKLDQIAMGLALKGASTQEKILNAAAGENSKSDILLKFTNARFSPFDMAAQMLELIDGLSANDTRSVIAGSSLLNVMTRLPIMPPQLIKDNIEFAQNTEPDPDRPWSTGFLWPLVGVQNWPTPVQEYSSVFASPASLRAVNLGNNRPITLYNPLLMGYGWSFVEALQKIFADSGIYEYYTDLVHFSSSKKVAPIFVARDFPMTFRKIWEGSEAKNLEGDFGWTVLDDIPRTSIDAASVVSISFTSSALDSPNYIRYNFSAGAYKGTTMKASATANGMYVNINSQRKFGSVVDERTISAWISTSATTADSDVIKLGATGAQKWFAAIANKSGNFLPYLFMFPQINMVLKQADYPLTVGMAVRVKMTDLTLVGFVNSIKTTHEVASDGKKVSITYLALSLGCMEESDFGNLVPLPRKAITSLLKYKPSQTDLDEVLENWKFKFSNISLSDKP